MKLIDEIGKEKLCSELDQLSDLIQTCPKASLAGMTGQMTATELGLPTLPVVPVRCECIFSVQRWVGHGKCSADEGRLGREGRKGEGMHRTPMEQWESL